MRKFRRALLGLVTLLFIACGGGESPELSRPTFSRLEPNAILSSLPKWLTAHGTGFGNQDDSAVLRFTAVTGRPFQGGTSTTVDVAATVGNASLLYATTPFGLCAEETWARVKFVRSDGAEAELRDPVLLLPGVKHEPSEGEAYDQYGLSIAIEGSTLLAGGLRGRGAGRLYDIQPREHEAPLFGERGTVCVDPDDALCGRGVDITRTWGFVGAPEADLVVALPGGGSETREAAGWVMAYVIDWTGERFDPPYPGARLPLHALDVQPEGHFGEAVAATESGLIVGSPGWRVDLAVDSGAAYVFHVPEPGSWPSSEARLLPFRGDDVSQYDGGRDRRFGAAVAIHLETAVVGSAYADGAAEDSGAVYVYVKRDGTWEPQQKLVASDGETGDRFGASVAVSGDTVVVGAPENSHRGPRAGSAYVFRRSAGVWTEHQRLGPGGDVSGQDFGRGVAMHRNRIVVGAPNDANRGIFGAGAAFVYDFRDDGHWYEVMKLVTPEPSYDTNFGWSVDLDASSVVVGAPFDWRSGPPYAGSIFLY